MDTDTGVLDISERPPRGGLSFCGPSQLSTSHRLIALRDFDAAIFHLNGVLTDTARVHGCLESGF